MDPRQAGMLFWFTVIVFLVCWLAVGIIKNIRRK
jgi:hypothetical protein